jgi:L-fuculose-phosphate aldolase
MDIREELINIGRRIAEYRLIVGPGGNISARDPANKNAIYIKASGKCFESAKDEDYIKVDILSGEVVEKNCELLRPSCEINMHLACYRCRKDVNAVIHTHPVYATVWGFTGETLIQFTPDFVAIVNSNVPVIKYTLPGTKLLADEVEKVIKKGFNGVILANHGLVTVGSNLLEAFYRTLLIEDHCKMAILGKLIGKLHFFAEKEINEIDKLSAERYRRKLLKAKKV